MEEESRAAEEKVDNLRKHHMKRPTYKEVTILVISSSYKIFAAEQKKVFLRQSRRRFLRQSRRN